MKFLNRHGGDDLHRELRSMRPEARSEYVALLAARLAPRRHASPRGRLALAVVVVALTVPFAAFGGVSMTKTAVKQAVATVAPKTVPAAVNVPVATSAAAFGKNEGSAKDGHDAKGAKRNHEGDDDSPAEDEYGKKCGHMTQGGGPRGENRGDKPCPPTSGHKK